MTRALRLLTVAAVAAGLAVVAPAGAAPVPNEATWTEAWITSGDGTKLHADVLLPKARKDGQKHPMIVSIGPYYGSGSQGAPAYNPLNEGPSARFNDLIEDGKIFEKGYGFVMVDSRGYGSSGGCNDFGGPGEQMDAKAAVEWAASQPFSTGKVGMWGKSYDAWTQVMALSQKPKGLAATVIQAPLIETYRGMFENGVHYDAGWYVTPSLYTDYDLTPPGVNDSPEEFLQWGTGAATGGPCVAEKSAMTTNPDHSAAYWQARDIIKKAAESRVPTLWSHGFNDVNTKPTNIFPVYSKLRGPKRAWFGQWDHVRGNEDEVVGREGFMDEAMSWFDHYLRGKKLKKLPPVEVQDGDGAWRTEQAWPPKDAVLRRMPLKAGSYVDEDANSASNPSGGVWSASQPAPFDVRIAGLMRLDARVGLDSPVSGNLVALVYDVDPDGNARLISRGATAISNANEGVVSYELWPQDWLLPKGHRLAVQLAGNDATMYLPVNTGTTVTVASATLSVPITKAARRSNLEGDQASAASRNPSPTLDDELEGRQVKADFGPRPTR
jgi:uncharacterized protein